MPLDYHVGATAGRRVGHVGPLRSLFSSDRPTKTNQSGLRASGAAMFVGAPVDIRRSAPRSRKPAAWSASRAPSRRGAEEVGCDRARLDRVERLSALWEPISRPELPAKLAFATWQTWQSIASNTEALLFGQPNFFSQAR